MSANRFRRALGEGRVPVQAFITSGSTAVARAIAEVGFDSLLFDLEHGAAGLDALADLVTAAGAERSPMVRVPSSEPETLARAVEAGVHGLVCPDVETPEEAARVVAACRSSPLGDVLAVVQIESRRGIENLEAIVATPGLDAILPGPSDLSVAFGGPPGLDYQGEASVGRLREILAAAHAGGVRVAMPAIDGEQMQTIVGWGADWIATGDDMLWAVGGARTTLAAAHDASSRPGPREPGAER